MLLHPEDTIVAVGSAPGPGARAIVRLSGAQALAIAGAVCGRTLAADRRCVWPAAARLPDVTAPLPLHVYVWPAPKTYTGQDLVELHAPGCPPLVELLVAQCLNAGARAAQPGEFTLRAFLAGKVDLPRAEAVLAVIEAGSQEELKQALIQLAGGVTRPLQELRDDLLNLLADLEAGLDFAEEDIHFVGRQDMLARLAKGLALLTLARRQLDQRAVGQRRVRVVVAGRPNAGKSSLFNALGRGDKALVSSEPGTTRDYLVQPLEIDGVPVEIIDTAGLRASVNGIEASAQGLGREQIERADLVLLCLEAGAAVGKDHERIITQSGGLRVVKIATKCDRAQPAPGWLPTSAKTGQGLAELRHELAERARAHHRPALAPSLSRCRHHVEKGLAHLRKAHECTLHQDPPEVVALELRGALDQLGEMTGAVYTDDLLDRIFSRFCIGK